jgi:hypothetical protein
MTIKTMSNPVGWIAYHDESYDLGRPYGSGVSQLAALNDFRDELENSADDPAYLAELLAEVEDAIAQCWARTLESKGGD